MTLIVVPTCRAAAEQLAEHLQAVYLRDKKASETVRAAVLETLGLLVEAAPLGELTANTANLQSWAVPGSYYCAPVVAHRLLCGPCGNDLLFHKAC